MHLPSPQSLLMQVFKPATAKTFKGPKIYNDPTCENIYQENIRAAVYTLSISSPIVLHFEMLDFLFERKIYLTCSFSHTGILERRAF